MRRDAGVGVLVNLVVIGMLLGLSAREVPETVTAPPETSVTVPALTTTVPAISEAVVATEPAVRVAPPTSLAPTTTEAFDCESYVNALSYEWRPEPPMAPALHDSYRTTALCLGWPTEAVDDWEEFIVEDVIAHESGGCWNLRRGARVAVWEGCVLDVQGTHEDSGFGQLIGVWWRGPGTVVCDRLLLCSSNDIIASPWNSMRALLVAVEEDGSRPWCYDARARRFHQGCSTVGRNWP